MVSQKLLDLLICPKCKSEHLSYQPEKSEIVCKDCGQVYRVEDDIPVMIVGEKDKL